VPVTTRIDRLGAGDLATLWAEEPATPMHLGLAGLLDQGPLVDEHGRLRLAQLREAVDARLARVPQLRRRIRWTGFGQGRPAVVDDQAFAIANHVTAVDLAGLDEPGFWAWCAGQTLEPFDRSSPLWRVVLATGLRGGQVGVLVVMHHALADGIAGAALAARLLDPAPDTVAPAQQWRPAPPPERLGLTVDALQTWLAAMAAALHRLLAGRGEPVEGLELRVSVPVGAPGGARNAGGSTPMVLPLPLAVAALSYAGNLVVSFQTDAAVADLGVLAAGAAEDLDALIDAGKTEQPVKG
jgi:hypothetical protein